MYEQSRRGASLETWEVSITSAMTFQVKFFLQRHISSELPRSKNLINEFYIIFFFGVVTAIFFVFEQQKMHKILCVRG